MKIGFLDILHSLAFRLSCYVALAVSFVMMVGIGIITHMAKAGLQQDAIEKTENSFRTIVGEISQVLEQAETATRNYDPMVLDYLDHSPEKLTAIPHFMIEKNSWLEGATLAFERGKVQDGLFAPFSYRDSTDVIHSMLIPYDYTTYDWFLAAYDGGKESWGEPFMMSGTHGMITIFSHPVRRSGTGETEAVCCADVSLERMKSMVNESLPYKGCTAFMTSRAGNYLIHPNNEFVLQKNIQQQSIFTSGLTRSMEDSVARMLQTGTKGHIDLSLADGSDRNFSDGDYSVYYCPVEKTGWSLVIVCPHSVVFAGVNEMLSRLRMFFLVSVIILLFTTVLLILKMLRPLHSFTQVVENVAKGNYETELPVIRTHDELYQFREAIATMQLSLVENIEQLKLTVSEQSRMENELKIAKDIQQNLLSKAFSPYIDWPNLQLYALLESAREVGGDLYDFFIRDRKLFFCVGDVSGKGVPAALFMAVTRGLFRVIGHIEDSPADIISSINHTIAADNPQNMFVTMLCGCLNLDTGHLSLANAGHNPPIIVSNGKAEYVNVLSSVPLGFFEDSRYKECELSLAKDELFLAYTDGVTEAENPDHALFGEDRLLQFSSKYSDTTAQEFALAIRNEVRVFASGAEQSDDLTMFCMRRLGNEVETEYLKYVDFNNEISEVEKLFPFMQQIQRDLNLDEMLVGQLNLAVEEALVNAIKYAYPEGEKGIVKLTVECPQGKHYLRLILIDYGIAFDPTSAKKADITVDALDRPIGGLGIFLVNQIMTSVEYTRRNQSNILLMTKNLSDE